MRINSAQDGASEYSISAKMDVMIRSLGQITENTDGAQFVQSSRRWYAGHNRKYPYDERNGIKCC